MERAVLKDARAGIGEYLSVFVVLLAIILSPRLGTSTTAHMVG